ncbi:carcinoembryonic antigen-related cell adhesion molecule 2-like isoform X1 [Thunnus maccoyii]|uniref:carcinoembryonic antigen-related cell adhesion molecule 2-like isoform X1 n=1 Tax=Thunnus maccoyii TaxID=8240 RepID=UPI001C4DB810|nr:carcinoembryonic antigen-related cell adhesion molecule 2-like isoform X1 [Thunnus maccoyii]
MDNTYRSKQNGGHSNLSRLLLLLFLAGLQPVLSTDTENAEPDDDDDEGLKVKIVGPNFVTVGVPSSIECVADCSACTYSMSLDGHSAQGQGNVLDFTLSSWVEALTVTCTVTDEEEDEDPEQTSTVTKQLQVLAGPANVTITGPDLMNPTVSHTYSCHGYCRPSCIYAWKSDTGPWIRGQGNVISITPQMLDSSKTLLCKATNSVSGMFVTTARNINVMFGPTEVKIKGPDVIEIEETSKFVCTAECLPSCRYVLSVDSQTVRGNVVEITMEDPFKSVTLKCEAQNTASRKTATALKTVRRKGSDHNLSTRPEETSAVLLLAFVISAVFIM